MALDCEWVPGRSRLVQLCLVGPWLCGSVRKTLGESVNLCELVVEPGRVEERSHVEAYKCQGLYHGRGGQKVRLTIIIWAIRFLSRRQLGLGSHPRRAAHHVHRRCQCRPEIAISFTIGSEGEVGQLTSYVG